MEVNNVLVTVYELPGCAMCQRAREFLADHHVRFTSVNVLKHPSVLRGVVPCYYCAFPILRVGRETVSGFGRDRLRRALELARGAPLGPPLPPARGRRPAESAVGCADRHCPLVLA